MVEEDEEEEEEEEEGKGKVEEETEEGEEQEMRCSTSAAPLGRLIDLTRNWRQKVKFKLEILLEDFSTFRQTHIFS